MQLASYKNKVNKLSTCTRLQKSKNQLTANGNNVIMLTVMFSIQYRTWLSESPLSKSLVIWMLFQIKSSKDLQHKVTNELPISGS